ncbi:hypothetical protein BpHYR1_048342 [Brachionus plicatilis]|uniref:Uncharacterized protein n=1 Tax=Brachionus plicatilis TaxID=10195 RepID=A0A3M7PNS9_BRAPC|nr:hypothetical protein BpHYR1_048342 [Brachionus plicatilis]
MLCLDLIKLINWLLALAIIFKKSFKILLILFIFTNIGIFFLAGRLIRQSHFRHFFYTKQKGFSILWLHLLFSMRRKSLKYIV